MRRGMRLKARQTASPDRKVRLVLSGPLVDELERYRVLYRSTHGDEIEIPELIEGILEQFLASDRFFQRWRRDSDRGEPKDDGSFARTNHSPSPKDSPSRSR